MHTHTRVRLEPGKIHSQFRRRGITQNKEYSIKKTVEFWNQDTYEVFNASRQTVEPKHSPI